MVPAQAIFLFIVHVSYIASIYATTLNFVIANSNFADVCCDVEYVTATHYTTGRSILVRKPIDELSVRNWQAPPVGETSNNFRYDRIDLRESRGFIPGELYVVCIYSGLKENCQYFVPCECDCASHGGLVSVQMLANVTRENNSTIVVDGNFTIMNRAKFIKDNNGVFDFVTIHLSQWAYDSCDGDIQLNYHENNASYTSKCNGSVISTVSQNAISIKPHWKIENDRFRLIVVNLAFKRNDKYRVEPYIVQANRIDDITLSDANLPYRQRISVPAVNLTSVTHQTGPRQDICLPSGAQGVVGSLIHIIVLTLACFMCSK